MALSFSDALNDILHNRNMSVDELSTRTGIPTPELQDAVKKKTSVDDETIELVAKALAVPEAALFATKTLPLSDVPDFRRKKPRKALYDAGTLKAISFVEKISGALTSMPLNLDLEPGMEPVDAPLTRASAKKLAEEWRAKWGITDEEQIAFRSSHKLYSSFREFVENQGVFVLHFPFKSDEVVGIYTKVNGGGPHTIVINTTGSSKARKLFTLAHEFCHVLLRKRGASDPSVSNNKVETFCNQFAAFLLAPESVIREALRRSNFNPEDISDTVRLVSNFLGVSQHCTILRFLEMGVIGDDTYRRWRSQFSGYTHPDDTTDGSGGGAADPIHNKRTQYGFSLIRSLSQAKAEGYMDAIDVFRLSGIKPRYQLDLLGV